MPSLKTAKTVSRRVRERAVRFFDASALAKPYANETHGPRIRALLGDGEVLVSRLSQVEVASAINRRCREGFMTAGERDEAIDVFLNDYAGWTVMEISPEVTM